MDHPCVCGEKFDPDYDSQVDIGITPAYAGKSAGLSWRQRKARDHPCVCGEKFCFILSHRMRTGSPLRMRGKVASSDVLIAVVGITPAYAGKRTGKFRSDRRHEDHPCVCGEKF